MNKKQKIDIAIWILSAFLIVSALLPVFISLGKRSENKSDNVVITDVGLDIVDYAFEFEQNCPTINLLLGQLKSNKRIERVLVNIYGYGQQDMHYSQSLTKDGYYALSLMPTSDILNCGICSDTKVEVEIFVQYNRSLYKVATRNVDVKSDICDVKTINSQNIYTLLNATSGTFVLEEDIDMAKAYTVNDGIWTSTLNSTFTGTINGNGHVIKNFKTNTGLFNLFNGTIRNLAFIDVVALDNCGVISKDYTRVGVGDGLIKNVYISIKSVIAELYVGFVGSTNPGNQITIKDSILLDKTESFSKTCFFGRFGSTAMSLDNAYLIGGKEFVLSYNTSLTKQEQYDLHLPDYVKEKYVKFDSIESAKNSYLNGEIRLSDWIDSLIEKDLDI